MLFSDISELLKMSELLAEEDADLMSNAEGASSRAYPKPLLIRVEQFRKDYNYIHNNEVELLKKDTKQFREAWTPVNFPAVVLQ